MLELEGVYSERHVLLVRAAFVVRRLSAAMRRVGAVEDGAQDGRGRGDICLPVPGQQPRQPHQLAVAAKDPRTPVPTFAAVAVVAVPLHLFTKNKLELNRVFMQRGT